MTKKTEEQRALDIVKKGNRVDAEIRMSSTSVISVRLPREVLRELELEAEKAGIGMTTYARLAIEEKLALSETASLKRMSGVLNTFVEQMEHAISTAKGKKRKAS